MLNIIQIIFNCCNYRAAFPKASIRRSLHLYHAVPWASRCWHKLCKKAHSIHDAHFLSGRVSIWAINPLNVTLWRTCDAKWTATGRVMVFTRRRRCCIPYECPYSKQTQLHTLIGLKELQGTKQQVSIASRTRDMNSLDVTHMYRRAAVRAVWRCRHDII